MYKISQFSKISGLSVKALRYYDTEDILNPSFRDEENQYRYYDDTDLKKAFLIKQLRSMEFSIMELKEVMKMLEDEKDLTYILHEKMSMIEKNIAKEKQLLNKIEQNMLKMEERDVQNQYCIDMVEMKEVFVASIKFKGNYTDLDTYIPLLYKAVKNNKDGNHFNCYYDEECVEIASIEVCIPVKKVIADEAITCKTIPAIKALHTIHYGSYDNLYLAYKSLFEYANTHHLNILMPIREVYIKSPGMIFKGNPNTYVTEILFPISIL